MSCLFTRRHTLATGSAFVEPQEGSGSGSILDQQGNILTNYHVIEGAQKLSVSMGGQKDYAATIVGGDPDTDLAVIRLLKSPPVHSRSLPMGDSDKLVVGQKVLAIGNPFWFGPNADHWSHQWIAAADSSAQQSPHRRRNSRRMHQSTRAIQVGHCSIRMVE